MPSERLNEEERARLGTLAHTLHCHRVRLYREDVRGMAGLIRSAVLALSGGRAVALGHHVFLPRHCSRDLAVLAHELTHCCQYQAWGPVRYYGLGLVTQLRDLLYRWGKIGASQYHYRIEPGKPFSAYGMEQQGQIVEDCFRGQAQARSISPYWPGQIG